MSYTPLNSLNAFVAVARRRGGAAAARELGVSSSALSQSVRQLERGKKSWKIVVEGPMTTSSFELSKSLAVSGAGLLYSMEALIADEVARGKLQLALESYATTLPGLYLYFPSRANLSPPLRAFVDLAREMTKPHRKRPYVFLTPACRIHLFSRGMELRTLGTWHSTT